MGAFSADLDMLGQLSQFAARQSEHMSAIHAYVGRECTLDDGSAWLLRPLFTRYNEGQKVGTQALKYGVEISTSVGHRLEISRSTYVEADEACVRTANQVVAGSGISGEPYITPVPPPAPKEIGVTPRGGGGGGGGGGMGSGGGSTTNTTTTTTITNNIDSHDTYNISIDSHDITYGAMPPGVGMPGAPGGWPQTGAMPGDLTPGATSPGGPRPGVGCGCVVAAVTGGCTCAANAANPTVSPGLFDEKTWGVIERLVDDPEALEVLRERFMMEKESAEAAAGYSGQFGGSGGSDRCTLPTPWDAADLGPEAKVAYEAVVAARAALEKLEPASAEAVFTASGYSGAGHASVDARQGGYDWTVRR